MQSTKTIIITTAILTLMILGAGCTDTGGVDHHRSTCEHSFFKTVGM